MWVQLLAMGLHKTTNTTMMVTMPKMAINSSNSGTKLTTQVKIKTNTTVRALQMGVSSSTTSSTINKFNSNTITITTTGAVTSNTTRTNTNNSNNRTIIKHMISITMLSIE
jgi:hypothetical protein